MIFVFQNFQDECEKKLHVLEEADESAKKMSCHNEADVKVSELKVEISHLIVKHGLSS